VSDDRVLRADARRNRERLIAVAGEAFSEHGVGAPMDDIARRAGVGPGTLYRHFPTKEALLLAVYRSDVERIAERAKILADELPPFEALAAWCREQLDYISHRYGVGAAIKTMLGTDAEVLDICRNLMRSAIGDLLRRAQQAGEVRADADPITVLRLVHAVGVATETDPSRAEPMLDIVLSGLETPRAPVS
jgi:AcrR family transcriptional regulator